MQKVGHYINGQIISDGAKSQPVYNPSKGIVSKEVLLGDAKTIDQAVAAAKAAFPAWSKTPPLQRARIMFKFKALLEQHADEICRLIGEEHGKIIHDARGELQRAIENVEFACGIPELLKGEHSRNVGSDIDSWSQFHPLGVVAGITPFNFPVMVPLWMFPMAIACGNTFVLKPS